MFTMGVFLLGRRDTSLTRAMFDFESHGIRSFDVKIGTGGRGGGVAAATLADSLSATTGEMGESFS